MKKRIFVILLILIPLVVFSEQIIKLSEINKPQKIYIDMDSIYITEGATIFMYSLKDYKFLKKFGKMGFGHGEMRLMPHMDGNKIEISFREKEIFIFSRNKVLYFSKNGEYLREIKALFGIWHKPLKHNFIGRSELRENNVYYLTINIFDNEFKIKKEICRFKSANQQGKKINFVGSKPSTYQIVNDKIVIDNRWEGFVHLFNLEGDKLFDISVKPEKIKFTHDHKKGYFNYLKKHPALKNQWGQFRQRLTSPEYFPYFKHLLIGDNLIYIQTYKVKNENSEFLIYDLNGEFVKRLWIPIVCENVSEDYPYSIRNQKIYQLVENLDAEEWNLNINKLDINKSKL